jgi:GAF domain-containing protein/HAMP domain-containing protein
MTTAVDAPIPADGAAAARERVPSARRGPRRRLFAKYAAALVGLVSLVLLINGSLNLWFSYDEATAAAIRLQREKAVAAAQRIEEFIAEIEKQIGWTTATQWASAPIEQRRFDFGRLQRQVPAITELIQLDNHGQEQLKVSRLAMDVVGGAADYAADPRFTGVQGKKVWFGPVYFRKESEPYMTMAVAHSGRNAGVTVAEVNLKLIWDVITAIKIGKTGYAYVVDDKGRLIAHPDISRVLRNTDLSGLPQVEAARGSSAAAEPDAIVRNLDGHRVLSASAAIPKLGWLVFVEQPLSEALAPLFTSVLQTGLLLVLGLAVAILAGLLLARRMTGPIRALDTGAARIGAGALDHRIAVHTGDELEELAERFNTMASDLQSSYANLEKKVEDRTAELTEALDQQTATAEVLGVINSSPGDLVPVFDAMLDKAMRLCSAAFGYLMTYDGERFQEVAHRGLPPRFAEYLPRMDQPGPSGAYARIKAGAPLVHIADLKEGDVYLTSPLRQALVDLGGARTSIIVALRKDEALLGVLTIYRQEVRPFSYKQIALLQNFAAQAVIAMENARLITETREALEQQTATAEVLGVINSSPGDLAPVFDAMLEKATRLCEAPYGQLATYDGEFFRFVAVHGYTPFVEQQARDPVPPSFGVTWPRIVGGEHVVHMPDVMDTDIYRSGHERARRFVEIGGGRSLLTVALRKDDVLLGALSIYRQEVRPFSDKEIALLQNFAAQAVIAMENARLITETREALEQQTATAEVLGVINSSPGDLAPVFDAMLERAMRLCEADFGIMLTVDGATPRIVAERDLPEALSDFLAQHPPEIGPDTFFGRAVLGRSVLHTADMRKEAAYRSGQPLTLTAVDLAGVRALLMAPLIKDDGVSGVFAIFRREVRPFTDKQIALLQNFAAQAVIAMENARLITETREALEQQTATAEVLGVINSSPGDLGPVFDAMLDKAIRLCEATHGHLFTYDGELFHHAAARGEPRFIEWARQAGPVQPYPNAPLGRIKLGERIVHVADIREEEVYRVVPIFRESVELRGVRSQITVALLKDNALLGAMVVYRQEVRPFSDKQIALLQNFAAQAVIAMENARLITETHEALEQQTATAEVLGVINSSPGDLAPVFEAMLDKAIRLCEAAFGKADVYDGELFLAVALHRVPASLAAFYEGVVPKPGPNSALTRIANGENIVHVKDMKASPQYLSGEPRARALVELGGCRSYVVVALRKDGKLMGTVSAYRQETRPFSDKQIALLENFAAQAVIAMENARLITETREALEQQTATAEVLGVINSSPGDLVPVFDAILEKAHNLCGATFGSLNIYDGEENRAVAVRGLAESFADRLRQGFRPGPQHPIRQLLSGARIVQVPDAAEIVDPIARAAFELAGLRTVLLVPLRKDDRLLGQIVAARQEVRLFSEKEISLLENFAAQAVIAMENVRLITELRESLEYQTATSDVLRVISGSVFDLDPVLQSVVATAIRLCRADQAVIYRNVDGEYRWAAGHSLAPEYERLERDVRIRPGTGTLVGRAALEARTVHILDALTDPLYEAKDDARIGGVHTMIGVPLLREGAPIGVIGLARQRVEPFSEREIQLVTTFADQAVIAIENARLLNDLQQRTRDLQESLEYQTATSEVLKVISRSTGELQPILQTLAETAARLCESEMAFILRRDGEVYRAAAALGWSPEYRAFLESHPIIPNRGTLTGRVVLEGRAVQIADITADPEYTLTEASVVGGARTQLGVPLMREGSPIGVIILSRQRVEPFTEKQIALVTTFADQAVIAIENARLFNELRDRTAELGRSVEELKMLSEVGQAVSSTLDLRSVLSTILTSSLGLTWANAGAIFRYSRAERAFRLVEAVGWDEALRHSVGDLRLAESETAMGEAVARRTPVQLADTAQRASNPLRDLLLAAGFHSALIVPLVGAERILGAIILMRQEAGEFPPETVRLMQTLASQSVLAIQNARMFREIADKSEQLALASQHKSQFLANMSHELRTPLNAILGYAELLVDGIYGVLPDRPKGVLERIQNNGRHLLALINDVLDLAKIEAGQLTLTLENYSLPEVVRSVVTATEPLATGKGLKFTAALQEDMPKGHGDARRLSQVLLNLVGNAIKFTDQGEVEIRGSADRGHFVLEVRDTGPGIPDADQERIFGEFQQIDNSNTRQKGGTGLGLAISKRMVEMQGGTIAVESALGEGSTFRVVLPVHVDEMMEAAE